MNVVIRTADGTRYEVVDTTELAILTDEGQPIGAAIDNDGAVTIADATDRGFPALAKELSLDMPRLSIVRG